MFSVPVESMEHKHIPTVTFHMLKQTLRLLISSQNPSLSCADTGVLHLLLSWLTGARDMDGGGGRRFAARDGVTVLAYWLIVLVALWEQPFPWAVNHRPVLFPTTETLSGA